MADKPRVAVALRYEKDQTPLPMVVAKGQNLIAEKMIRIAEEEGIPIMQNIPLAHALHDETMLDDFIPLDLMEPVAEVLRWVRTLDREEFTES